MINGLLVRTKKVNFLIVRRSLLFSNQSASKDGFLALNKPNKATGNITAIHHKRTQETRQGL